MSKARREMQVLGDFLHTGAQAAGTWWRPTAASGNGELDSHEVAEVVAIEIVPPVTGAGAAEDLRRVHLVLDGTLEQYNLVPGTDTYLVTPPRTNVRAGRFLAFGKPVFNVENGLLGLLQATCPKYRKSLTVEAYAGGAITASYRIRLWGYRYRAEDLAAVTGVLGGADSIFDPTTGRMSDFVNRPPIQPSEDTWTQLPGGLDQAVPKIFHFLRMAFNANATTANVPFEFRFDIGNVASREEDLYFPYDTEKKVAIIQGLGVRAPANLLQTWVDVAGDERPKSRIPTTQYLNPLHFGKAYPLFAADHPEYFTVPLLDNRIMVANEKAVIRIVDNGTSIAANQIAVVANGVLVELT
ncbi:MAG: hypothetical protein AB1374_05995 [Bacillota bacterium]